mmetsp:Transcript_2928/g.3311  ORF Transcript_2928/g.3311 Transcript_2928/m.3311 type:complete len:243 (-) Transcript_2928:64-792(-)
MFRSHVPVASSSSLIGGPSSSAFRGALTCTRRHRFYKPLINQGINLWRSRMGRIHKGFALHSYRHSKMDEKPSPEPCENNYYGRTRLWNAIPSKVGVVNKKSEDFGWPHRRPPPTGIRQSPEYFPHFFSKYFPDVECRLVVDSVLNNETTKPVFLFPPDMSKADIGNYLKNVYGFDNIVAIHTRNLTPRRYKNEVGSIKLSAAYKQATVILDAPVKIDFKAIKGTEDTPDNQKRANQVLPSS